MWGPVWDERGNYGPVWDEGETTGPVWDERGKLLVLCEMKGEILALCEMKGEITGPLWDERGNYWPSWLTNKKQQTFNFSSSGIIPLNWLWNSVRENEYWTRLLIHCVYGARFGVLTSQVSTNIVSHLNDFFFGHCFVQLLYSSFWTLMSFSRGGAKQLQHLIF